MTDLECQIAFLAEADKLNTVLRRNYVVSGGRRENSAEHSWHVSLAALILSEHCKQKIDLCRVLRMLLIHDLVEIDAGDTFVYDQAENETKVEREKKAADRIFGVLPARQGVGLRAIWDEFEAAKSPEAKFAYAVDRFVAVLHNAKTAGRGWTENHISAEQVLTVNSPIAEASEKLWEQVRKFVADARAQEIL
ncbi:MAG: HD domain-containing protein [Verrucomicrobia bacterium]|nr:HD domain-containing protein [Verrucomicrobiota bacterium]MBV9671928.1 HD domain-containing protein [Verrucomicrobiota bacterium]